MNVWLALLFEHHLHRSLARAWWTSAEGQIALTRFPQISLLRLLTTSSAMDGKPLDMPRAWRVYDRLFEDDRVVFLPEPAGVESRFRQSSSVPLAAPKIWADAWLLAVAREAGGTLVTFDEALATRAGEHGLWLMEKA